MSFWLGRDARPTIGRILALAVAYFVAARIGLSMAFVQANVSPVWPPTGLAIAALLLGGRSLWPAILVGSFFANWLSPLPPAHSAVIALGNTAEALLGAWLVARFVGARQVLDSPSGVVRFVLLAGLGATLVSASVGVATLTLTGVSSPAIAGTLWTTWWLGDAAGAVIVAPILLAWAHAGGRPFRREGLVEAAIFTVVLLATALLAFGPHALSRLPLAYVPVPLLALAVFRFGRRGATMAIGLLTALADWGTVHGDGSFATGSPNQSLVLLQTYIAEVTLSTLLLGAVLVQRRRAEDANAALAADLAQKNLALTRLDGMKDEFVSMVSHELRTPLASIQGYAELLEDRLGGPLSPEQTDYVAHIQESTRRLDGLVSELLDFARLPSGDIALDCRESSLASVAEAVAGERRADAALRGLSLSVGVPERPVLANVDADRVAQVLRSLLDNALKFTPQGGEVEVRLRDQGDGARLEVRDTGIGLSPDQRDRVFERFYQVDPTATRAHGGAGLGLAVAKAIVDAHGGAIGVESALGEGSTFWVELPKGRDGSGT